MAMRSRNSSIKPFSVVLVPNGSLSTTGFRLIVGFVAAFTGIAGIGFIAIGAWPVFGFLGLDVALISWALCKSRNESLSRETIDMIGDEVVLRKIRPGRPATEYRFVRSWLRVDLDEDAERELIGQLTLTHRERRVELGSFLAPDDRKSLAHALKSAVAG